MNLSKTALSALICFGFIGCGGGGGGESGSRGADSKSPTEYMSEFPTFDSGSSNVLTYSRSITYYPISFDEALAFNATITSQKGFDIMSASVQSPTKIDIEYEPTFELDSKNVTDITAHLTIDGNNSQLAIKAEADDREVTDEEFDELFGSVDAFVTLVYLDIKYDQNLTAQVESYYDQMFRERLFSADNCYRSETPRVMWSCDRDYGYEDFWYAWSARITKSNKTVLHWNKFKTAY